MPQNSFGMSMNLSQRQEMIMTPQMIQSMEMLQLPLMALEQKIQQELQENPALELLEMQDNPDAPDQDSEQADEIDSLEAADNNQDLRKVDAIDYEWDEYYDESAPRRHQGQDEERFNAVENAPGREISFADYLLSQLTYLDLSEIVAQRATRIINNLDPAGYITVPLTELTSDDDLPTEDQMLEALDAVQQLDPPGIGARNVRECLLLQIDRLGIGHMLERELVEHHLEDLAANRLPQIARSMVCDLEDIKKAGHFIRTLNPHPGLEYGSGRASHIQPDVIVDMDEDDNWDVRLVGSSQPDISDMFLALFDTTKRGRQLRDRMLNDPEQAPGFKQMQEALKKNEQGKMLRDKYQSARWLITAVAQRERTLLRVSKEIVGRQKQFLSGMTSAPAPLMMQEIADIVGIDISTVSRAVRDKYMETPIGLKPLRMFFTRAVGGDNNGATQSNIAIMNQVREIIENEDKKKPLKDDEIMRMLAVKNIDIKRRTVAKYRSNLGFPSHSQRREY